MYLNMHVRQAQTLQKRVCSKIRGIHVHPSQAEALNSRFMIDDLIKFSGTFFISSFVILYFHIDTLFWIVFKSIRYQPCNEPHNLNTVDTFFVI